MVKNKPWNVDLSTVAADEQLHTDYKTETKEEICNVKLKTTRISQWEDTHNLKYNEPFSKKENISVKRDTRPNGCHIIKLLVKSKVKLTISFFHTDGTLMVQGEWLTQWSTNDYPRIMAQLQSQPSANKEGLMSETREAKENDEPERNASNEPIGKNELEMSTSNEPQQEDEQVANASNKQLLTNNKEDTPVMTSIPNRDQTEDQLSTVQSLQIEPEIDDITLAKAYLAQEDQDIPLIPSTLSSPTNHEQHKSPISTGLSTPQLHGKSKAVLIKSQFETLEDKFVQLCDDINNRVSHLENDSIEKENIIKQLKENLQKRDSMTLKMEDDLKRQNEQAFKALENMEQRIKTIEISKHEQTLKAQENTNEEVDEYEENVSDKSEDNTNEKPSPNTEPVRYYLVQGTEDPLSNFYRCPIESSYEGTLYNYSSIEQAFQHKKALTLQNVIVANRILRDSNPVSIKQTSRGLDQHPNYHSWAKVEIATMKALLQKKLASSKTFSNKLLATGNALLLHSVVSKSWGIGIHTTEVCHPIDLDSLPGENIMGKLLMDVRSNPTPDTSMSVDEPGVVLSKPTNDIQNSVPVLAEIAVDNTSDPVRVLLMGSSNTKYVQPSKLFGSIPTRIIRTSTAEQAKESISSLTASPSVEIFILHVGLNDLREGSTVQQVSSDLQTSLNEAATKYPKAKIGYSELLHVGHESHLINLNKRIASLNDEMHMLCSKNGYVYIQHPKLQKRDDLYEDAVHFNSREGVRSFVMDLHQAISPKSSRNVHQSQSHGRRHYNSNPNMRYTGTPHMSGSVQEPHRINRWEQGPPRFPTSHSSLVPRNRPSNQPLVQTNSTNLNYGHGKNQSPDLRPQSAPPSSTTYHDVRRGPDKHYPPQAEHTTNNLGLQPTAPAGCGPTGPNNIYPAPATPTTIIPSLQPLPVSCPISSDGHIGHDTLCTVAEQTLMPSYTKDDLLRVMMMNYLRSNNT